MCFSRLILGNCSEVGTGIFLAGGVSFASGTQGLLIAQIMKMEVITWDGRILIISPSQYPNLFNSLKGAGVLWAPVIVTRYWLTEYNKPPFVTYFDVIYDITKIQRCD